MTSKPCFLAPYLVENTTSEWPLPGWTAGSSKEKTLWTRPRRQRFLTINRVESCRYFKPIPKGYTVYLCISYKDTSNLVISISLAFAVNEINQIPLKCWSMKQWKKCGQPWLPSLRFLKHTRTVNMVMTWGWSSQLGAHPASQHHKKEALRIKRDIASGKLT